MNLADWLSEQIEYNYDKQMEKCLKKMGKKEQDDDVGEDMMTLDAKRGKLRNHWRHSLCKQMVIYTDRKSVV